jgi:MinD-like ATPase involved in chromosome partitioning or flagellar assembly
LDLVLPLGSLTALAGLEAGLDLLDLINLDAGERTPTELRKRTPWVVGWRLFLIPGARDPRRATQLRAERVGPLLQALRATFDLTFVDLGRSLSRLAFLLFSQADLVVFLVGPDEPTAENGRRILTFLREEGVPEERILVVSNRPTGGEPMSGQELERRLGRAADLALPYSGSHFALASSLHAPFSLRFPEESATKVLRDLAGRVIEKLGVPTG